MGLSIRRGSPAENGNLSQTCKAVCGSGSVTGHFELRLSANLQRLVVAPRPPHKQRTPGCNCTALQDVKAPFGVSSYIRREGLVDAGLHNNTRTGAGGKFNVMPYAV